METTVEGQMETKVEGNACRKIAKKLLSWCWRVVKRRLKPDSALFAEGDLYCRLASKCVPVDERDTLDIKRLQQFSCGIANCMQSFDTLINYESHYNSSHRHVCQTCHRTYPVANLLDIHIVETHDVMFSLLAQKQNMFQCLLTDCSEKFRNAEDRRRHMIGRHKYPANYRYDRCSKHKKGRGPGKSRSGQHEETMDTDTELPAANNTGRTFSYKVPNNVCFGQGASRGFVRGRGRGRGRGGQGRGRGGRGKQHHWHNMDTGGGDTTVDIEAVDMKDLEQALS